MEICILGEVAFLGSSKSRKKCLLASMALDCLKHEILDQCAMIHPKTFEGYTETHVVKMQEWNIEF